LGHFIQYFVVGRLESGILFFQRKVLFAISNGSLFSGDTTSDQSLEKLFQRNSFLVQTRFP
jgi:hypothetical protein